MDLENLVIDAVEPQRLGQFWEAVVGGERLTDESDGFETRLTVEGGPVLDLCFQRVPEPPSEPPRRALAARYVIARSAGSLAIDRSCQFQAPTAITSGPA